MVADRGLTLVALTLILLLGATPAVNADEMSNTVPADFVYALGSLQKSLPLSVSVPNPLSSPLHNFGNITLTLNVSSNSTFTFTEEMLMFSRSGLANALTGASTPVTVEASNTLAILRLRSNTTIGLSVPGYQSVNVPIQVTDFSYALADTLGSEQSVSMTKTYVDSVTIPVIGLGITIFMRPVVHWLPVLSGSLNPVGNATVASTDSSWTGGSKSTTMSFTGNGPAALDLSNPSLMLQGLSLSLEFPLIVEGLLVTPSLGNIIPSVNPVIPGQTTTLLYFQPGNSTTSQAAEFPMTALVAILGVTLVASALLAKRWPPRRESTRSGSPPRHAGEG